MTTSFESVEAQVVFKGIIANAVNGYLNNGHSINPELRSEPVQFMDQYFERVEENLKTAATIQSRTNDNQMTLAIGKASYQYWKNEVDNSATSAWTTYLTGNVATDLNDIPYWVTAAMFGSRYSFGQVNSNSAEAIVTIALTTLAGSLVVSAGKVLFHWVPKENGNKRLDPTIHSTLQWYNWICFDGSIDNVVDQGAGEFSDNAAAKEHALSQNPGCSCYATRLSLPSHISNI